MYSEAPLREIHKAPPAPHDRWLPDRLRGYLKLRFDLLTPLHIGGPVPLPAQQLKLKAPATSGPTGQALLVRPFYRQDGRLVLPGASLKGAIRSLLETFTYSCAVTEDGACRGRELCLACRVFGALGHQGLWAFSDGRLQLRGPDKAPWRQIWRLPPQYAGRGTAGWRRYYPHLPPRQVPSGYAVEVLLPERIFFTAEAHFANLLPEELGALLIALGQAEPPLCPKIGGGKNAGLGSVRVTVAEAELWAGPAHAPQKADWSPKTYIQKAFETKTVDAEILTKYLQPNLGCAALTTGDPRHG